jgi:hypothetical protein
MDDMELNPRAPVWSLRMMALPEHGRRPQNMFRHICARSPGKVSDPGDFSKGRGSEGRVTNGLAMRTLWSDGAIMHKSSVHSVYNFVYNFSNDHFGVNVSFDCRRSCSATEIRELVFEDLVRYFFIDIEGCFYTAEQTAHISNHNLYRLSKRFCR